MKRLPQFPTVISQEIANAPASAALERAKAALAECISLDQAKGIANEAKAIASYAMEKKGAGELLRMARQIQIRAFRRIGQLLKDYKGKLPSQPLAMENVATRIAKMAQDYFEQSLAVDAGSSPSAFVNKFDPVKRPPAQFRSSGRAWEPARTFNHLHVFIVFIKTATPRDYALTFKDSGVSYLKLLRSSVRETQEWLDKFEQHLPKGANK